MDLLYDFGQNYGMIFLIILSWYVLWDRNNLFFYYNVGLLACSMLNTILKGVIQQPRPMFDSKKVELAKTHARRYFFQNGIPYEMFGMPSGHAQLSLFSTVYVYLALKHTNLLYLYLVCSILICYQRIKYDYHTFAQIIVGAMVGAGFAYFVYHLARDKIKGRIREKPDDFGPV
ncbi:MAG: phosphatase PAP2 family protein [Flavobacterium sp.]